MKNTHAAAILVKEPLAGGRLASLISANPYHDFARTLGMFYQPPRPKPGIHPQASIAATARIGEGASVGAFAVIGEHVSIGKNAVPVSYTHLDVYKRQL